MIITVFEDQNYKSLFPLNLNRASFELRCGAFTNLERIQNMLGADDSIQLVVRDELVPLLQERYPNITINPYTISAGIWLNGRGLWMETILDDIKPDRSYTKDGCIIAVYPQEDMLQLEMQSYLENASLVSTEIDIRFIKNIWDGIFLQSDVIIRDEEYFIEFNRGKVHPSVAIENGDNIFICESA